MSIRQNPKNTAKKEKEAHTEQGPEYERRNAMSQRAKADLYGGNEGGVKKESVGGQKGQ